MSWYWYEIFTAVSDDQFPPGNLWSTQDELSHPNWFFFLFTYINRTLDDNFFKLIISVQVYNWKNLEFTKIKIGVKLKYWMVY
jgi:hypothetical protein